MSVIKKETIDVRRVGTALIGGDFTGNARGNQALDIQTGRTAPTQVATSSRNTAVGYGNTTSGYYTSAIGYTNTVSGYYSSAFGYINTASGNESLAIGHENTASGYRTLAIGHDNTASGYYSTAIGYRAKARIQKTVNIGGVIIQRKDDGEAAGLAFESFCGAEVILMSKEVDLEAVAEHTITLPANCKFWLNEIGLITTVVDTLITQPTVRYGITGDLAKHNAAAITTNLTAAGKREIETPLVPGDGEISLTAGVTIVGDAAELKGRFYWKGMLIEDE